MRLALQNIHLLPLNLGFHDYAVELLRQGRVDVLYFSDSNGLNFVKRMLAFARDGDQRAKLRSIDWKRFEFAFSARELRHKADVLLNLNLMCRSDLSPEFTKGVSRFDGLKVAHVGDYFWYRPGSELNRLLRGGGFEHLLGYAMHDRYCSYFETHFPEYSGKVWGIPFGFASRFQSRKPFNERHNRAVAVGSVNPLRPLDAAVHNYRETADFFPDECWFHKSRRNLVLEKNQLGDCMDSMLPEFPAIKDFRYDLPDKFNAYRMFVSCESIFWFPPAKYFEGPACGSALICADHDCNREYGFEHERNCIMYEKYNSDDFRAKVVWCQQNESRLEEIAAAGHRHVSENFAHAAVANRIWDTTRLIWERGGNVTAIPLAARLIEDDRSHTVARVGGRVNTIAS